MLYLYWLNRPIGLQLVLDSGKERGRLRVEYTGSHPSETEGLNSTWEACHKDVCIQNHLY